jgi:tetratricopeptide (TPR) repeat protein
MRSLSLLLPCIALVSACASAPPAAPIEGLLADALFAAPSERVTTDEALQASDEMKRYLAVDIASALRTKGLQGGLVEALYKRGELKLEYDATATKNAAQAFAARSGNCLSLVLMTASLARELGLGVRFQSALLEETWGRNGTLLFASGHVNITLEPRSVDAGPMRYMSGLTIDFLPAEDLRGLRVRDLDERTVLAMYANNRAVEALSRGLVDDAYAWAREALRTDPAFTGGYNTLGVVYLRKGELALAEKVFDRTLVQDARNTRALANLAETYLRQGRPAEAEAVRVRLASIESVAPFHFFQLGLDAARQSDWATARDYFAREVARADYYHEFHFWLGVADWQLGDTEQAQKHLRLAMDSSTTRSQHDLYAAKLAWLQSREKAAERTPTRSGS